MALSSTLATARTRAPCSLAALTAAMVSLVSPDWLTAMTRSSGRRRLAVADLAGQLDDGGDARELLDPVAAGHGRVGAGAARHEVDAPEAAGRLLGDADLVGDDVAGSQVDAAAERVLDDAGLLVDLFEHEVLVAAALGHG
jgi:hypothetical protein